MIPLDGLQSAGSQTQASVLGQLYPSPTGGKADRVSGTDAGAASGSRTAGSSTAGAGSSVTGLVDVVVDDGVVLDDVESAMDVAVRAESCSPDVQAVSASGTAARAARSTRRIGIFGSLFSRTCRWQALIITGRAADSPGSRGSERATRRRESSFRRDRKTYSPNEGPRCSPATVAAPRRKDRTGQFPGADQYNIPTLYFSVGLDTSFA